MRGWISVEQQKAFLQNRGGILNRSSLDFRYSAAPASNVTAYDSFRPLFLLCFPIQLLSSAHASTHYLSILLCNIGCYSHLVPITQTTGRGGHHWVWNLVRCAQLVDTTWTIHQTEVSITSPTPPPAHESFSSVGGKPWPVEKLNPPSLGTTQHTCIVIFTCFGWMLSMQMQVFELATVLSLSITLAMPNPVHLTL